MNQENDKDDSSERPITGTPERTIVRDDDSLLQLQESESITPTTSNLRHGDESDHDNLAEYENGILNIPEDLEDQEKQDDVMESNSNSTHTGTHSKASDKAETDDDDDESMTNEEMIKIATEAAIKTAELGLPSDSVLFPEDDDDDTDDCSSNNSKEKPQRSGMKRHATVDYMESASMEVIKHDDKEHHQHGTARIIESGLGLARRESSFRRPSVDLFASQSIDIGDLEVFVEGAPRDQTAETVSSSMPRESVQEQQSKIPDAVDSQQSGPTTTTTNSDAPPASVDKTESLLKSCGALPLSCQEMSRFQTESDLKAALFQSMMARRKSSTTRKTTTDNVPAQPVDSAYRGNEKSDQEQMLYSLFATFCEPSPSLEQVRQVLDLERARGDHDPRQFQVPHLDRATPLPTDVLVQMSGKPKSAVIRLLCRNVRNYILKLDKAFQLAFFRILIRLLTNETNEEYNKECLLCVDWWEQEFHFINKQDANPVSPVVCKDTTGSGSRHKRTTSSMPKRREWAHSKTIAKQNPHQIYTVVRFRCASDWSVSALKQSGKNRNKGKQKAKSGVAHTNVSTNLNLGQHSAVTALLELLEAILEQQDDASTDSKAFPNDHLIAPVIRLLGLVCTAGVSVKEFRRILSLVHRPLRSSTATADESEIGAPSVRVPAIGKLLLVRALTTAAEGASISQQRVGKTNCPPLYFYSFGRGPGIIRNLKSLSAWPFRNDFGMAVWFRAERFAGSAQDAPLRYPTLLSFLTHDGGGIEVSLLPLETTTTNKAASPTDEADVAVLAVTVKNSNSTDSSHRVVLKGCVLLPKVWYHIAVRHTRSRLQGVFSLSTRQQLSIMLDGKVMLTEELQFPDVADSSQLTGSSSKLLPPALIRSASKHSAKDATLNVTATFGADFDGQTGSLYVFNDHVSEATLRALFVATRGRGGVSKDDSYAEGAWDSNRGAVAKRVSVDMTKADADEMVVTKEESGRERSSSKHSVGGNMLAHVFDLGSEEAHEENVPPQELSKAALSSKLFLVWDPKRTEGPMTLELHAGAHVQMDLDKVQPWYIEGPKQVIASIGSIQAVLPLFRTMLSGEIEQEWLDITSKDDLPFDEVITYTIIPDLLTMLASFLRNHSENTRETLRCGGIDVAEHMLFTNKKNGAPRTSDEDGDEKAFTSGEQRRTLMHVLSLYPGLAQRLLDSLLDLRLACSHDVGIETKVLSRLLFNIPLWFGEPNRSPGVALYAVILPVLSEITKANPEKIRDCVGIRDIIESLNGFTNIGESVEDAKPFFRESETTLFDRSSGSGLDESALLTVCERRHVIDIMLAMTMTVMASGTTPEHISSFLSYISFNLDRDWEQDSLQVQGGSGEIARQASRHERYLTTVKACTILLFLLQGRPVVRELFECVETCCGGTSGFAGWLLCAMVNSFDDGIRSLGVRCLDAYLEIVAPAAESFFNVSVPEAVADAIPALVKDGPIGNISPQVHKRAFDMLNQVGKGLANAGIMAGAILPSKLNVQVVYKLLWHLLKCHRSRIQEKTHSATYHLLLDDQFTSSLSLGFLLDGFVTPNDILGIGYNLNTDWAGAFIEEARSLSSHNLRDSPAISTVLRLLRFLPDEMKERWLKQILDLVEQNRPSLSLLAANLDWQPCLFILISEILDEVHAPVSSIEEVSRQDSTTPSTLSVAPQQGKEEPLTNTINEGNVGSPGVDSLPTTPAESNGDKLESNGVLSHGSERPDKAVNGDCVDFNEQRNHCLESRYNISLKLYATLLGHSIRQGNEKAIETTASLQRICLNGEQVLCLVLSHLLFNLVENGTILDVEKLSTTGDSADSPLKQSANIVTKAILSSGSNGMDMASATRHWRSLRHLTAVVVAVVTKCGCGVSDMFDYQNQNASVLDVWSGGLHGIRLPDWNVPAIPITACTAFRSDRESDGSEKSRDARQNSRRVCVTLAAELLLLLDDFIFTESLDASVSTSQMHGLALVRRTESRVGLAQGPLLASLVRASLILLCNLEPISVKFLQCCSRLRCFLHWTLELVRESVALAGYSAAFQDLTAPLDRLVLAIVLHSHRALSRCSVVLFEIEASSYETYFPDDKTLKKSSKRLFRVVFELREIVLAAYKGRNEVLKAALSLQAFDALQASLEKVSPDREEYRAAVEDVRDEEIRTFLSSPWVAEFHDIEMCGEFAVPEQVSNGQIHGHQTSSHRGLLAIEELASESRAIVLDFDRGLDSSFAAYCEGQRKWAETDNVRDLEYNGDLTLKRLSGKHKSDTTESNRAVSLRLDAAQARWDAIDREVSELWSLAAHWRLPEQADRLNRRILLVRNREFQDHQDASYELMLGRDREKAEKQREERLRKKQEEELAALMRRNEAAFVPYEEDEMEEGDEEVDDIDIPQIQSSEDDAENDEAVPDFKGDEDWDQLGSEELAAAKESTDADGWAKAFIWADSESIVARFEEVTVVTLRTLTQGKVLVTTHGLYFHPTGDTTNVMTKQSVAQSFGDRRWRLNRLTEVHGRRYMLRQQALELFFADTHELFLNFNRGMRERDRFYAKVRNSCKVPLLWTPKSLNPKTVFKKSKITELWKKRKISNFQYLMHVNCVAGRSFNDISQYPVFPWVLADYTSETLDLKDSRVYRDLSKPVGALNPDRLAQLIERYKDLSSFGFPDHEKFLYGSHYSSPGNVLHFLIRQEPFTTMAVELQSGRFDCPDRLFFDIEYSWNSCLTSSSDVKELTPEFFTCPEILLNTNNFPLGKTQNKRDIHDVALPPWANGSAYEFVRLHRLALESEYVSQNINHWIDLIFGYKQRGPEAEAAHNIFHYLSYEGAVDLDKINDEVDRKAAESHIQNFGQTPSQLLQKDPHPRRLPSKVCWEPLLNEVSVPQELRCHTPSRQFGGKRNGVARGAVLSISVLTDALVSVYSDLSVGTYKLSPWRRGGNLKMDKHRTLGTSELSTSRSAMKRGSTVPLSEDSTGDLFTIGNKFFATTPGGVSKENFRRKTASSRVNSSKDLAGVEASLILLSCGYWDNTVKAHSVDGLKLRCNEGGHRGKILCLGVGSDGALMVTGGEDATCRVWVVDHPDMSIALSDGYVKTARGGSTNDDKEKLLSCCHVLWGHDTAVTCISVSSELDLVVSGSIGGTVCIHNVRLGSFVRTILPVPCSEKKMQRPGVRSVVLDKHGVFVVHMEDGGLHSYTVNGILLCSEHARDLLHDMKICSDGEVLVTGGDNGHVLVRTVRDLQIHSTLDLSRHGPIKCISLTPEELNPIPQFMFIGSEDGMITAVNKDPSEEKREANK